MSDHMSHMNLHITASSHPVELCNRTINHLVTQAKHLAITIDIVLLVIVIIVIISAIIVIMGIVSLTA